MNKTLLVIEVTLVMFVLCGRHLDWVKIGVIMGEQSEDAQ